MGISRGVQAWILFFKHKLVKLLTLTESLCAIIRPDYWKNKNSHKCITASFGYHHMVRYYVGFVAHSHGRIVVALFSYSSNSNILPVAYDFIL